MKLPKLPTSRRTSVLLATAVVLVLVVLIWPRRKSSFYLPPLPPLSPEAKLFLLNGTIWHKSCGARYSKRWDDDIPKSHVDEMRLAQCMLPSPRPEFKPHVAEWADDEVWRQQEAKELTLIVQQELHILQNPSNCSRALLCSFDQECGMGCKLHHVVHCFALAYASRRMLLMVESGYPYQQDSWWGTHLRPLSDTCSLSHFSDVKPVEWTESTALGPDPLTLVPLVGDTRWFPALYPFAIPRHLAERLSRMHCAPHVWWVGQLLHFLLRPNPKLQIRLRRFLALSSFKNPIVGLHVRHSDKAEGARHWGLEYYMPHVQAFVRHHGAGSPPRVFVATDDPNIPHEARTKYGQYEWIFEEDSIQTADMDHRYSSEALEGSLLHLLLIGRTDYLVCTFSSNLCRAAYELLQVRFADGSWRVTAMDHPYYLNGQRDFVRTASQNYSPSDPREMNLTVGDPVDGSTPRDTSHCQGTNVRTGQKGLYPYDKVQLLAPVEDLPKLNLSRSGGR